MTEKLHRARTLGELIRGVVLVGIGARLVLVAVHELRATAPVVDLPTQPAAEPPADSEAPAPA